MIRLTALPLVLLILSPAARVAAEPRAFQTEPREYHTEHYTIHSDLDSDLTLDLGRRMEAMYSQYSQRLAAFGDASNLPPMQVWLFRHQRDYLQLTGHLIENSGGLFLPGRNLLAAFLDGQGREQLRRTLQHEAFHQFAYNAICRDLPVWLNEGLAQFFEEGLWNGDNFTLGEVPPRRIRRLQADLRAGRFISFTTLLPMDDRRWAKRLSVDRELGAAQYNQSWAMVHFLVMARDSSGRYLYRARLVDLLRRLHDSDPADAFAEAFGTDVRGFQDRFLEYARGLRPTAEATLIENQDVLADLLVDLDRRGRRFEDMDSFRRFIRNGRFRINYTAGDLHWETSSDTDRYFSDPDGRRFAPDDLYLSLRTGSPLPDIVCRYENRWLLRTRFYDTDGRGVDHDLLIEPVRMAVSISN